MSDERWLGLPGFPGYEISDVGAIRNARTGKLLKLQQSDSGYLKARIKAGGTRRAVFAHKAVLEAFVGPAPTERHDAAHVDGNNRNNWVGNLAWKLPEANEADKKRVGTAPTSFTGHKSAEHVPQVRYMLTLGWSYSEIGRIVGLHRSSVSRIARGLRHKAAQEVLLPVLQVVFPSLLCADTLGG
jgi:hypothetical protein